MREHFLFDQRRGFPLVETGGALRRDALERAREIGLLQRLARLVRHAVLRERGHRRRILLHRPQRVLQRSRQTVGHREAVAREGDGGIDKPFPGQLALFLPREVQAGDGSRHADGEQRAVVQFAAVLPVLHPHRRRRLGGRFLAEIVGDRGASGGPVDDEAAAADVAGGRMHDGERERGGDGGVDRGPAGADHVRADAGGNLVLRRDHAFLRANRHRARAGGDREGRAGGDGEQQAGVFHGASVADYTRCSFQRPRRKSRALTTDISENATAIAQKIPGGP